MDLYAMTFKIHFIKLKLNLNQLIQKSDLIQNIYSVNELEQAIAAIDEEISKRKQAEL